MLDVSDLDFSYGDKTVLKGVSFSLKEGEIVAICGISGVGKTTLFRLIVGLLLPTRGSIQAKGPISYMRQQDLLLPWRTVLKNISLLGELEKKEIPKEAILEILEKVGLKGCEEQFPSELSLGMRQRVSLARTLLQNRPILLLDEPFGSLDVLIREELYTLVKNTCRGKSILLVTHDFRDALNLCDRILILSQNKTLTEIALNEKIRHDPETIEKIRKSL